MRRAALALALTLTACGGYAQPPRWEDPGFSVQIDPTFTPDETETVLNAFDEWFEAMPETRIPVSIGATPNVTRMTSPARINEEGRTVLGSASRAGIVVWADTAAERFPSVIRHEIGHFLGGLHTDTGTALSPLPLEREPVAWHCISAADIAAVCEGRGGCLEKTTPSCK